MSTGGSAPSWPRHPDRRRALVTGGSSPLGDVVLPALMDDGHDVVCAARSEQAASRCEAHGAQVLPLDLDGRVREVPTVDVVVHMAGVGRSDAALELVARSGARALVVISSASATVAGHPDRDWILAAERRLAAASRVDVTVLRPTMIYGSPRDRNLSRLVSGLRRLPVVPRFRGGGRVQPVLADDVARAIVEATTSGLAGTRFVGGPRPVLFGDLVDAVSDLEGHRRTPFAVPIAPLSRIAARVPASAKSVHAVEMLAVDRAVPAPCDEGFAYRPTELRRGVEIALGRYADATSPGSGLE